MKHKEDIQAFLASHDYIFRDFGDRETKLDAIVRYQDFDKKLYPTTLRSHQYQVSAYVAMFLEFFGDVIPHSFDRKKALIMAWIHDDLELFMQNGDVPSSSEAQRSDEMQKYIENDELFGIREAERYFPEKVGGYVYGEILLDAGKKLTSLEAQMVKFCDKMTGLAEALHEIEKGNVIFLERPYSQVAKEHVPSPKEYYAKYIQELSSRLPRFTETFAKKEIFLLEELKMEKDYQRRYDFWRKALCIYAPQKEIQRLQIIV